MKTVINPWEVKGDIDYSKIVKEFGIKRISNLPREFDENILFRRNVVFGHRDFERILDAIKNKKEFIMMTGLMPSGKFHLGHMIVAQQFMLYQNLGAKLYIALGLKKKNCDFYFQSERSKDGKKASAYYNLATRFARYATFNEFKAVYGELSPGKIMSSLLQASDMFHAQLPEFEGRIPVVVPVGIDQDPHLRIARDIGSRFKDYNFIQLSSTYHTFLPSLKGGGKMSSSDESSFIAMTDSEKEVENKIKKYSFSGGQQSIEEHRKKGGNPNVDVSFQYLKMFF